MNVVPAFLRKNEPAAPPLPPARREEQRQLAMEFMSAHDRVLEENAYLRSEVDQLRVEVRVANERARMLEGELNFVRDDRDRVTRHDSMMLGGVDDLVALALAIKERSRIEAYAPPGSAAKPAEPSEQDRQITSGLAEQLASEAGDA